MLWVYLARLPHLCCVFQDGPPSSLWRLLPPQLQQSNDVGASHVNTKGQWTSGSTWPCASMAYVHARRPEQCSVNSMCMGSRGVTSNAARSLLVHLMGFGGMGTVAGVSYTSGAEGACSGGSAQGGTT